MQKLANFISALLHPLFMPLFGVILVFRLNPFLADANNFQLAKLLMLLLLFNTVLLPGISIFLLYKTKLISSLELESRNERFLPFLITLFFYGITYWFLKEAVLPDLVYVAITGSILALIGALLISLFFKISIHLTGISGITGLVIAMFILFNQFNPILLSILIMLCGATAWSRLYLNAHKPKEVYTGFIFGFITMLFVVLLGLRF